MKKELITNFLNNVPKSTKIEIIRFVLSFVLAWIFTALLNDFPSLSKPIESSQINPALTKLLVILSEAQLNILGFQTYSKGNFLQIIGNSGIRFEYSCLGIRHLMLFAFFILFHMGKWYKKVAYIVLGSILLIWINSLRAVIIAISQNYTEETMLVHDISTPILMYISILILWVYWANTMGKYKEASV